MYCCAIHQLQSIEDMAKHSSIAVLVQNMYFWRGRLEDFRLLCRNIIHSFGGVRGEGSSDLWITAFCVV